MTTIDEPTLFPALTPVAGDGDAVPHFHAHARSTDPETSHEAAASIGSDKIRVSQQIVLDLLRVHGPMHDRTLADVYAMLAHLPPQSESGLRTRRSELVARGLVVDSGERVVLPSGRKAIIWKAAA
jgi:hypothetical protein